MVKKFFQWLFGRKKKQQVPPGIQLRLHTWDSLAKGDPPLKRDKRYNPILPSEATPPKKKKDSSYWDPQDFPQDYASGDSHHHHRDHNEGGNQGHTTPTEHFHGGQFSGGGASGSWDTHSSSGHQSSHGSQDYGTHSDSGSHSHDASGYADSGGGDSGGDSGGGSYD